MENKKNEKLGSLEEESLKRKERLKNLKKKAEIGGKSNQDNDQNEEQSITPVFRSYKPQDEEIRKNIAETQLGNIEEEVKDQLELLKTPIVIDDIDIANLAPRKPDWDLKRDVAKKLEKLERRTQKAIAELIRERLKGEGNLFQTATNIDNVTKQHQNDH